MIECYWSVGDVIAIIKDKHPNINEEEIELILNKLKTNYVEHIQDRLSELGWEMINWAIDIFE